MAVEVGISELASELPPPEDIHRETIEPVMSEADAKELVGVKLDQSHYRDDRLYGHCADTDEPVFLEKPNGEPLAIYIPDAIPTSAATDAYTALRPLAIEGGKHDGNRGDATGKNMKKARVKEDGSVSDTLIVPKEYAPNTGVAGYFDRYVRIPYCRQTMFNANNPEKFRQAVPMFQHAAAAMKRYVPERYDVQQQKADNTVDDWLIERTPFTTVTVNLNWQTATHTDAGDLPEGFGVMTVTSAGEYSGAYYMQPQYGTAFDLRTGDVILSDVHEFHGNGPFRDSSGYYERLSCVLYYRREMDECGTPEQETERAAQLRDLDEPEPEPEPTQRSYGDELEPEG